MPIKGKRKYTVYLTESEVEYLKMRIDSKVPNSGGLSALFDDYVCKLTNTLRKSGNRPGERMTWEKVIKLLAENACDSR